MRLFTASATAAAAATESVSDIRFRAIAAGNDFASAITREGKLYTWGSNADGQLGTQAGKTAVPTEVTRFPGLVDDVIVLVDNNDGAGQTLALSKEGKVYAWGRSQLGDGSTSGSPVPVEIPTFTALADTDPAIQISAGDQHDVVLTKSGRVYTWGNGRRGALGTGDTKSESTPVDITDKIPLKDGEHVVQVSAGFLSSVVVTDQGRVYNWGGNVFGDLGDGTMKDRYTPAELVISGLAAGERVVQASLFSSHTVVRTTTGALFAWGLNSRGSVGNGTAGANVLRPVAVAPLPGLVAGDTVVKVEAGQYSTLALTESGAVYAWGWNGRGELGDGSTRDSATPVKVLGMPVVLSSKVTDIAGGGRFSLALTDSGEVFAWGSDDFGQLGDQETGNGTVTPKPIVLGSLHGSATIEGGAYTGMALHATPSTAAGDWHPAAVFGYQWLRSGVPILGATSADYTMTADDAAVPIAVTVTGRAPNWAQGTATSASLCPKAGKAPKITSSQPDSVTADEAFRYRLTASGSPTPTIGVEGLPSGLTLDAEAELITGSVGTPGAYTATVTAANGIQPDAKQELTVTVDQAGPGCLGGDGKGDPVG